jgi:hypothetical protein
VVELDGHEFHSSREHRRRDAERAARLTGAGWQLVVFTYDDVVRRPELRPRHRRTPTRDLPRRLSVLGDVSLDRPGGDRRDRGATWGPLRAFSRTATGGGGGEQGSWCELGPAVGGFSHHDPARGVGGASGAPVRPPRPPSADATSR